MDIPVNRSSSQGSRAKSCVFAFSTFIRMKNLLPLLLLLLLGSCADPRDKIPFPVKYTWKDTVLDYRLSNHDVVIIFPNTDTGRWWVDCYFYHKNNGQYFAVLQKKILPIKAHEMRIRFDNEDSLSLDSIGFQFCGLPEGGNLLNGHTDAFYDFPQLVTFIEKPDHRLHYLYSCDPVDGWYVFADSLLHGKDSAYFRKKALVIYSDSLDNHRIVRKPPPH